MPTRLITKFEGDLADQHRVPAYEAAQTLYGVSRSLIMMTNYLSEGRVRQRNFENIGFELNIVGTRAGSFETLFELICDPSTMAMLKDVAMPIAQDVLKDFIKSTFRRAIGGAAEQRIEDMEEEGDLNAGDNAALVEAIEPALRESHRIIGHGAQTVVIIHGDNNVVNFNAITKSYVNSSNEDPLPRAKLMSIGSFNANSGNGRAYDYDEHRTIPFILEDGADQITVNALLTSFVAYARTRRAGMQLNSAIAIKYRALLAQDGRVKKIIIMKARSELNLLPGN